MPTPHHPPAAVRRALRKLGADLHDARRRRRLPMAVIAERAFTSRSTLQRVEAGDSSVSIGIYAAVLQALGLLDGIAGLADLSRDVVGQRLASADLPKRSRIRRTAAQVAGGSSDKTTAQVAAGGSSNKTTAQVAVGDSSNKMSAKAKAQASGKKSHG